MRRLVLSEAEEGDTNGDDNGLDILDPRILGVVQDFAHDHNWDNLGALKENL